MVRLILAELGVTEVSVQLAEADSSSDRDGLHVESAAAASNFHEREILGRHQATRRVLHEHLAITHIDLVDIGMVEGWTLGVVCEESNVAVR